MSLDHLYEAEPDGYVLIDLSQISLATAAVTFNPGDKFTVPIVRTMILATLKVNALKFKHQGFNKVVICTDNAKKGYWRRQEQDYYKRNRAIGRDKDAEDENAFDWAGYFDGLGVVIQEMKDFMPYHVIDLDHTEADDTIAVLGMYLTSKGHKVRIISSDGDFTQLHSLPNLDQYSPIQKKFVKVKSGSPQEDCLIKVIKGDRKDCVAPIKVRGDYWLNYEKGVERVEPTSSKFVEGLVGKSDEEIKEAIYEGVWKKASWKKIEEGETHSNGALWCAEQLRTAFAFDPEKVEKLLETRPVEDLAKLITAARFKRFTENRVLIDFNYIRQDIKDAIIDQFENYVPAGRSKMYSYFMKTGQDKLLRYLTQF